MECSAGQGVRNTFRLVGAGLFLALKTSISALNLTWAEAIGGGVVLG